MKRHSFLSFNGKLASCFFFAFSVCLLPFSNAQARQTVSAQFIGSQGFFIEGAGKKILLDSALPSKTSSGISDEGYILPPEDLRQKIESGAKPYDGIDLITVSHAHDDHFFPATVYGAMKNSPKAWLVASPEAYAAILAKEKGLDAFKDRIWIPDLGIKATEEREINGIPLGVTVTRHGYSDGSMRLMTFVFDLAGMRFLHLNEYNRLAEKDYDTIGFNGERADVAFLSYGYVTNGDKLAILRTKLMPKFAVISHVDGASPATLSSIQAAMDALSPSLPMAMPRRSLDSLVFWKSEDGGIKGEIARAP